MNSPVYTIYVHEGLKKVLCSADVHEILVKHIKQHGKLVCPLCHKKWGQFPVRKTLYFRFEDRFKKIFNRMDRGRQLAAAIIEMESGFCVLCKNRKK